MATISPNFVLVAPKLVCNPKLFMLLGEFGRKHQKPLFYDPKTRDDKCAPPPRVSELAQTPVYGRLRRVVLFVFNQFLFKLHRLLKYLCFIVWEKQTKPWQPEIKKKAAEREKSHKYSKFQTGNKKSERRKGSERTHIQHKNTIKQNIC